MQHHNRIPSSFHVLLAILSLILFGGCTFDSTWSLKKGTLYLKKNNSQISFLDGSASMRVEVEVYKGPLSKEVPIQLAELSGVVEDSRRALEILYANMTVSASRLGCSVAPPNATCQPLSSKCAGDSKMLMNQPDRTKKGNINSTQDGTILSYEAKTIQRPGNAGTYKVQVPPKENIDVKDRYIYCNTLAQILIDAKTVYSEEPQKLAQKSSLIARL